jgi:uncharacterized membrane protein YhaH (DUF805 family)
VRGYVVEFDTQTGQGIIDDEAEKSFGFGREVFHDAHEIEVGLAVDFVPDGDVVLEAAPVNFGIVKEVDRVTSIDRIAPRKTIPMHLGFLSAIVDSFRYAGRTSPEWFSAFVFGRLWLDGILVVVALLSIMTAPYGEESPAGWVYLGYFVVMLPPTVSTLVRRLHDADSTGWRLLLLFLPWFGWVMLARYLAAPSDRRTNKYGRHPRALIRRAKV